jgi:glucose-1-phosphate cytidylyltransferase
MSYFASWGHRDFLVACGYRGEMIKEYFQNITAHESDFVVDLRDGSTTTLKASQLDWRVGLIATGLDTMTGGRIRRIAPHLGGSRFICTYGDGLSDVDLAALLAFHERHGKLATVTAVRPPARFGGLSLDGDKVQEFTEKP